MDSWPTKGLMAGRFFDVNPDGLFTLMVQNVHFHFAVFSAGFKFGVRICVKVQYVEFATLKIKMITYSIY